MTGPVQGTQNTGQKSDPRVEAAAEAMFEIEFPAYSPTGSVDSNRWSWRGTGHAEEVRNLYRHQARVALAAADVVDPRRKDEYVAELLGERDLAEIDNARLRAKLQAVEALCDASKKWSGSDWKNWAVVPTQSLAAALATGDGE